MILLDLTTVVRCTLVLFTPITKGNAMFNVRIPSISCGHCVRTITEAIKALDPAATVNVEMDSKIVSIDTQAAPAAITASLASAGYVAEPM